jgi:uncharacterized tellurite resistance protein B-like protein
MNERAARCLLVARVLAADGFMTDAERETLAEAMNRHGLDESDRRIVSDMERMADAEAVIRALPEAARRAIVDELLEAALADGKLSPHETRVVGEISAAIGVA